MFNPFRSTTKNFELLPTRMVARARGVLVLLDINSIFLPSFLLEFSIFLYFCPMHMQTVAIDRGSKFGMEEHILNEIGRKLTENGRISVFDFIYGF